MTALAIPSIRRRVDRRLAILALLLAGLIGTGAWSLATISDTLQVNNAISVLTVDLQASRDGTTYTQSNSKSVLFESTNPVAAVYQLKNAGNGESVVTFSGTATGSAAILGAEYRVYEVANAAACSASTTGTNLASGPSTVASASSTVSLTLAPAATVWLCEQFHPNSAPGAADTATQVVTFSASSTLGTQ